MATFNILYRKAILFLALVSLPTMIPISVVEANSRLTKIFQKHGFKKKGSRYILDHESGRYIVTLRSKEAMPDRLGDIGAYVNRRGLAKRNNRNVYRVRMRDPGLASVPENSSGPVDVLALIEDTMRITKFERTLVHEVEGHGFNRMFPSGIYVDRLRHIGGRIMGMKPGERKAKWVNWYTQKLDTNPKVLAAYSYDEFIAQMVGSKPNDELLNIFRGVGKPSDYRSTEVWAHIDEAINYLDGQGYGYLVRPGPDDVNDEIRRQLKYWLCVTAGC